MQGNGFIQEWLSLFKLRITALLVFVALVTAMLAAGSFPAGQVLLPLAAAGALASMGASAVNNYLDRDIDGLMERTRRRPLPSGRISDPRWVLLVGCVLLAASAPFSLGLNLRVAFFTLAGALIYIVVYTGWLKRKSAWNIVIGGAAGSCAALAGWSAVTPHLSWAPILLALLILLWTPSHFWSFVIAYQEDYRGAQTPMLPALVGEQMAALCIVGHTLLVCAASLLLYFLSPLRLVYLLTAIVLGSLFLALNLALIRAPSRGIAWRNYKFSGLYLLGLFSAMLVDVMMR